MTAGGMGQTIGRFIKTTLPAVDGERRLMDALIQKTPLWITAGVLKVEVESLS